MPPVNFVVQSSAGAACPELAASDRAEANKQTKRPPGWATKGASKTDLLAHIDKLELSESDKMAAIRRIATEHERCRDAATAKSGTKKPPTS